MEWCVPAACSLDFWGKYCHLKETTALAVSFSEKQLRKKRKRKKAEGFRKVINYGKLCLNIIHPEANGSCLTFIFPVKTLKSLIKSNCACNDVLSTVNRLWYELCGPSQNSHVICFWDSTCVSCCSWTLHNILLLQILLLFIVAQ